MPYNEKDTKISNVKYVDRDFLNLKNSLIDYAKQYFPNSYRDFNETSPGMMLIEMSAYVGDVLNYYIDNQFQELMLPLAQERRNIINLARTFGYKNKAVIPAFAELVVTQEVNADVTNPKSPVPNYSEAIIIEEGMQLTSQIDSNIVFETLDVVDFTVSSSADFEPQVSEVDPTTGLASKYEIQRHVRAISGETKTFSFDIGAPQKYLSLTLPERNVVEILSCIDSSGNDWYEVEFLAQDKVPKEVHYSTDVNRTSAYTDINGNQLQTPVPYTLEYLRAPKRFVSMVDENSFTTLMFGNGILRNGQKINDAYLGVEQIGLTLPGQTENLQKFINPLLGDSYSTLGEAPTQTTLTITYRIGGGIQSNVASGDLTSISSIATIPTDAGSTGISVTNEEPATGGSDEETVEEIKQRVMNSYSTQNRCVTKEDYEARLMAMPAKFGGIAKSYVVRAGTFSKDTNINQVKTNIQDFVDGVVRAYNQTIDGGGDSNSVDLSGVNFDLNEDGTINNNDITNAMNLIAEAGSNLTERDSIPTIEIYTLSYNGNKELISTPTFIHQNLKKYLSQYRLITDQVTIRNGYVVNFGVVFDVVADRNAQKSEVKLLCIQAIIDYFNIDKMQFKQTLNTTDVEYLLAGIRGVRSVNHVTLTQDFDWTVDRDGKQTPLFKPLLYDKVINSSGKVEELRTNGYGYFYRFSEFYGPEAVSGRGVVLPAYDPAIFELKNPYENVKGVVR